MISLVSESAKPKLKFVKEQSDQYFIYDGQEEVGYIYCKNYYSNPKNRLWTIVIDIGIYKMTNSAYTIQEAKQVALETYIECLEYKSSSEKFMEGDY
jgi:hypothetical protein